ncbi:MAG: phosphonoacetaldehyde reductase [Leptolyngbya sp. SIO3F4]|nr:phosphonoacetaldehyde reductase [Leptolyngbya sp. SIO3F4]
MAEGSGEILERDGQFIACDLYQLPRLLGRACIKKPMVVVDTGALRAAELEGALVSLLAGFSPVFFDRFTPNPTSDDAAQAALEAASGGCDGVVAIGGGSACDVAKVVALSCAQPPLIRNLSRGVGLENAQPVPLIAVPTTSGTGSEATHFAAIYVDGKKVSVAHPELKPLAVVLDERFHTVMPATIAACSGLDALCQAIESMWAVSSTERSLEYARLALGLIAEHLIPSVVEADSTSRRMMLVGAHLAGHAINISKTTAAHALSYQLTQHYGIAHGHAVALTIGEISRWNAGVTSSDCLDERGPEWVTSRVDEACSYLGIHADDVTCYFKGLLGSLGLEPSLGAFETTGKLLANFAETIDPVRVANNPRRLDADSTLGLLRRAASEVEFV